ncbi:single-stranded DNA-binding protein [Variovorax sp. J22P168]|uniref:single-stranded DNA-binding protein n=1 Tax=Variovorax jilinensis TaxID=3053513 RepID=UPI00257623CB|nr:single-stranded DNA-binding protein [Variovorax sp. J22P168]MDM0015841.1 single-stranded DNA-binding protein [Variovorax sp. J22P168]
MNRIQLIGHVGRDPEITHTARGPVAKFSVATNEHWTDRQSGERMTHTEWHDIVCFDRLAEIAAEFLQKGSEVYVEGNRRTSRWMDKEGKERLTYEVRVDELRMLRPPRSDLISRTATSLAALEQLAKAMASGEREDVSIADFASMLGTLREELRGADGASDRSA